jgi:hypothetical protein
MAVTLDSAGKTGMLRAMLRATYSSNGVIGGIYLYNSGASSMLKYKLGLTGASWGAISARAVALTTPVLMTHAANGTIAQAQLRNVGDGDSITTSGLVAGEAGTGHDIVVDDAVITSSDACNITDLRLQWGSSDGTVRINTLLANRLLEYLTGKDATHFSAAGTIKVYTGAAPASADDAATGTELISFTTATTTWNDVNTTTGCTLLSTLTASASNSGTAGYARFSWTEGSETYVIQGSVGTSTEDFVVDNTSMTASSSYNLTAATMKFWT